MKKLISATVLLSAAMALASPVMAESGGNDNDSRTNRESDSFSIAVYGDSPYGCKAPTSAAASDECPVGAGVAPDSPNGPNPGDPRQLNATPAFIAAINRDPKVRLVVHTGDIHSGSGYCTLEYNQRVLNLWLDFKDPLIYTPGDNEWTDCQKAKEGGGVKNAVGEYVAYAAGHPVANLALVRAMFFSKAGESLGGRKRHVMTQAQAFDPLHPSDAEYVENVIWEQSGVLFVTINVPGGSNNDDDLWNTGAFGTTKSAPQIQEVANRTAADLRWLETAFAMAKQNGAKAVVIVEQADMWDLDGNVMAHIAGYEPIIAAVAARTKDFGKPVLLINGDSHKFRSDNPLLDGAPCVIESGGGTATAACTDDNYDNHPYYAGGVTNFHRLVVHGSVFPMEYIRLTVDPRKNYPASATAIGPLSWERVIP